MEILRIPTHYRSQMEYLSDDDRWYILLSLMRLSEWEVIEIEQSMRWWVAISIWKEACQLEKKARQWKKEEYYEVDPIISYNIPWGSTLGESWGSPQTNPNQPKPNQTKSTQTKPSQNNTNQENFIPDFEKDTMTAFVLKYFFKLWWKPAKKETFDTFREWYNWIISEDTFKTDEKEEETIVTWYNYWNERKLEENMDNKNWKQTFLKTWKYSIPNS